MIRLRRGADRGHFDHGWLNTHHTFSFGSYHDSEQMGFRSLLVMNEDWVQPGEGFGMHPHRDMEIVTYVLEGALEHQDSMGHGEVLRPGEFQRMSAGTGIMHSEFNPSQTEPVHLYQIWLLPQERGIEPSYEQRRYPDETLTNKLRVVAAPDGQNEALAIKQDAKIMLSKLTAGHELTYELAGGRHAWLQVLRGKTTLNGTELEAGDGAAASDETRLSIAARVDAEVMLFDLA